MYSADADGRGRKRTDADIFYKIIIFFLFCGFLGIHWSTGVIGTRPRVRPFGPPPPPTHHDLMKIYWVYHPDSTTTLAQRRQRWHGRRWHNYVGTTSVWSPSAQLRWCNVILPTLGQRIFAKHMPTMSAMLEKIRSENTCSLNFWRGICFPGVKYKISHKMVLNLNVPFT